jgi:SulP family sulfate permease
MANIGLKDIVSGLVTPIVIVTATLSYAALIFSGPLAGCLPAGLGYGLVGAGVMAILFAVFGSIPFAIAGPDSKPSSVLATLAAAVAAAGFGRADPQTVVLTALVGGTLFAGIVLLVLGLLKTGRWIRFIPYPVVGGFMAASGWLLASGGIQVSTGIHLSIANLHTFIVAPHLAQLASAVAFATALHLVRRSPSPWAFPFLLLAGTALVHVVLAASGVGPAEARASGWLLNINSDAHFRIIWLTDGLADIDPMTVVRAAGDYIALIGVTMITLLLSLIAIEVETRIDVDMDHELRMNGLANIAVGMLGGMAGTISVSRTLFNYHSGARHRISGLLSGVVCLALLAFGVRALDLVPVPMLGGLLIQLGFAMLVEWLYESRKRMTLGDYVQVLIILVVIVHWNFIAGIGTGVLAACVTFVVNTGRIRLVKLGLSRSFFSSRVDRPPFQQDLLVRHGNGIQIMWLQGFVFFGSANRLLMHVREIVAAQGDGICRNVILDFHQVLGIDSSAVLSLIKLRHLAEREGFTIAVAELPAAVEKMLRVGKFIVGENDKLVSVFADLDSALEHCEDLLLAERVSREEIMRSADEWLARELGDPSLFARMASYLELFDYEPGTYLFRQNEPGNSLYLLYSGRVSILYETIEGGEIRLRSMLGRTIVGEMGLYSDMPRGASVRVDQPAIAYRLSLDALTQMEEDDPEVAHAFHKFVVRTLVGRLDFANREIAGLQR